MPTQSDTGGRRAGVHEQHVVAEISYDAILGRISSGMKLILKFAHARGQRSARPPHLQVPVTASHDSAAWHVARGSDATHPARPRPRCAATPRAMPPPARGRWCAGASVVAAPRGALDVLLARLLTPGHARHGHGMRSLLPSATGWLSRRRTWSPRGAQRGAHCALRCLRKVGSPLV